MVFIVQSGNLLFGFVRDLFGVEKRTEGVKFHVNIRLLTDNVSKILLTCALENVCL